MTALPDGRIAALDGLRGVAVMGILLMNVVAFAMPEAAYFNPLAYGSARPVDLGVWAANAVLTDGKMRSLFSMLFGASMTLVIARAEAAGEDGARVHLRRMAWLLVFGLLHYYLIWWGDILFHYAAIGCVALLFVQHEAKALLKWSALFFLAQMIVAGLALGEMAVLRHAAALPGASEAAQASWRAVENLFGRPTLPAILDELALYRGPWIGVLAERLGPTATDPLRYLWFNGAETLALVLLGMAGLKSGFLTGAWPRARYLRLAGLLYAVGLPPMIALVALVFAAGFDPLALFGWTMLAPVPLRPILACAHAGLLLWWLTGPPTPLKARAAAAGRMAFSNYLGTSLLMTALFYGWGFGQFGDVGRAELYLVVAAACALMLAWSKPWLERFRYGPLEWLWRSLARGKSQPMRMSAIAKHSH